MPKMLLIIPPCFTNRELDFEIGFPTNLLLLGSTVRSQGWHVEYLDMTLEEKEGYQSFSELGGCLADDEIKIIGISNHTVRTSVTTRAVADYIKSLRSDVSIIVGGVNATFMWRELLEGCRSIDNIIRGYAQPGLRNFLRAVCEGPVQESIPGLVRRLNGNILVEPLQAVDPSDFTTPSFEGINVPRYLKWSRTYPLLTHTGCGFSCNFCTSVMPGPYQSKEVYRPTEDVVAEIRQALNAGFERLFMSANIFTSRREYCLKLCDELSRDGISDDLTWVCMTRVEFVDEELLLAMRRAGCINIAFGIETAGRDQWQSLRKGRFSQSTVARAFRLTKEAGISTTAYLMVGDPFQTQEDIEATLELTREIDPDYRVVSFFQPFPGTPYWDSPDKFGLSDIAPIEEWNFHEAPICRTRHFDKKALLNAAIRMYLDRGSATGIAPSENGLKSAAELDSVYADIPEPARAAFAGFDEVTSVEDVLGRVTLEHGTRGRLIALYWLSAAIRDGVVVVA